MSRAGFTGQVISIRATQERGKNVVAEGPSCAKSLRYTHGWCTPGGVGGAGWLSEVRYRVAEGEVRGNSRPDDVGSHKVPKEERLLR